MVPAAASRRLSVGRLLAGTVLVAYPILVWFGLTHWNTRSLSLVLLVVLLPAAAWRLRTSSRKELRSLAAVPLVTVLALVLAALANARGYVLKVPVAINAVLLFGFLATLRPGSPPMIERMARLRTDDLSGAKRAWCRMWTWIWCGFFIVNGSVALVLANRGVLSWWALYNGLIAYVLIGVLLGAEWLLRQRRFGPAVGDPKHDLSGASRWGPDSRVGDAGRDEPGGTDGGERPGPGAD